MICSRGNPAFTQHLCDNLARFHVFVEHDRSLAAMGSNKLEREQHPILAKVQHSRPPKVERNSLWRFRAQLSDDASDLAGDLLVFLGSLRLELEDNVSKFERNNHTVAEGLGIRVLEDFRSECWHQNLGQPIVVRPFWGSGEAERGCRR